MGIDYRFNVGYGFILPEDKFALPAEWAERELWYDGDVDKDIEGSGLIGVFGGNNWSGPMVWGFVAKDSLTSMNPHGSLAIKEVREVEPHIHSNLQDIRSRVKMPKARIGWVMWADVS